MDSHFLWQIERNATVLEKAGLVVFPFGFELLACNTLLLFHTQFF